MPKADEIKLPRPGSDVRREILGLYKSGELFYRVIAEKMIHSWLHMVEYAEAVPSTKPRTPMDVPDMVARWKACVVGIVLAPDKATIDSWESQLNDLLEPFLKAPVKQIREFCVELVKALEEDQQVPFMLKNGVIAYIRIFVDRAKDTEVLELKKDIAMRIAKAVEGDVQPQLVEAITNALMWRDPSTLKQVEKAVKKGGRPRLRGKESCLFLAIEDEAGKQVAEVML